MIKNKILFSLLAIAYTVPTFFVSAIAREEPYAGKCLYIDEQEQESEFKSCQVNIEKNNVVISFKKEKYQDNNKQIAVQSVQEIASGEYATKLISDSGSIISGILLGPINIVARIIVPNKDFQQYVLTYEDAQGTKTATVLNINRSDAPEFQQELSIATKKLITFQTGQTNNTIDIGPDL